MTVYFTITLVPAFLLSVLLLVARFSTQFWRETDGVISKVTLGRRTTAEKKRINTFDVEYRYVVDGRTYLGKERLDLDVPYYQEFDVMAKAKSAYAPGDVIAVYYPSAMPSMSSARRGLTLDRFFWNLALYIILVVALYYLGVGYFAFLYE